jgi:hypothetical protein
MRGRKGANMTERTVRPEDFSVGSAESRAAARAALEARDGSVRQLEIVSYIERPRQDNSVTHIGPWQRIGDGSLMRIAYVSPGTGGEAIQRLLAAS